MTKEKQRIAIAEACGWKYWHIPGDETLLLRPDEQWPTYPHWKDRGIVEGDGGLACPLVDVSLIPDYLRDLNAMHEAEKVLTFNQWPVYVDHLIDNSPAPKSAVAHEGYEVCHATATQRAEAFLRTIGKWEESE